MRRTHVDKTSHRVRQALASVMWVSGRQRAVYRHFFPSQAGFRRVCAVWEGSQILDEFLRRGMGVFIIFRWGWPRTFRIISWHRAVECFVSASNCVIYILPLLSSYKYDDIVVT